MVTEQTTRHPSPVRFPHKQKADFGFVVKQRVHQFLEEKKLSRHADYTVYLKTVGLLAALIGLYIIILSEAVSLPWLAALCVVIGIVQGLVGVNICHDALHGSYSSIPLVNKLLGHLFDVIGPSSRIWKSTHNFNHHIYTNIPGLDHDIDKGDVLCLSPKDNHYWFHRYQHIYSGILYCFTTLNWIFYSDYLFFFQERKKKRLSNWAVAEFLGLKALNLIIFLIIPLMVMSLSWWQILFGLFLFQAAGGMTVALIFQMAHLVDNVEFPEPDPEGLMKNQWADHEMLTTANFGTHNIWLTHIVGGLNFQIEHHLFPYISHVHYPKISPIVRETAKEFNLPYFENPSFFAAFRSHIRTLKRFGNP